MTFVENVERNDGAGLGHYSDPRTSTRRGLEQHDDLTQHAEQATATSGYSGEGRKSFARPARPSLPATGPLAGRANEF